MLQLIRNCSFRIYSLSRFVSAVLLILACYWPTTLGQERTNVDCVKIERILPPQGIEIDEREQTRWSKELRAIDESVAKLPVESQADVRVLTKAVSYAIQFRELYQAKDAAKVERLLRLAQDRVNQLQSDGINWQADAGRQVRGFVSAVDGSVQPLGLILPKDWSSSEQKLPLYVWLHGRGDKSTDLHFICERLDKDGEVVPPGAIVLHPFGRQCVGYKSAGETDVLEAIDFVCKNYPVDQNRIVLIGFSMGGAGVWHLAAHYPDRFVAASPGAGFAETARYQNLKPENYPPAYEQLLWGVYDVPGYTRNLFNLPFVAYSGELDKQIQAARVMEEAFQAEGRTLPHLIGPGMGHKYHPETLRDLLAQLDQAARTGRPAGPQQWWLQSKHPRYNRRQWLTVDGMQQQYADTRVDARLVDQHWELMSRNASRLQLDLTAPHAPREQFTVDGQTITIQPNTRLLKLSRVADRWQQADNWPELRKHPQLSGPIDDAFLDPFLVVIPTGKAAHPRVEQWVACEMENFIDRWKGLFRGAPRTKLDRDVTASDMQKYHLLVWGDMQSNSVLKQIWGATNGALPLVWNAATLSVGPQQFAVDAHVPLLIYPNPLASNHYIVVNSGPTFRQAHDRTNSLQNPHLPDWTILSLDEPPSASQPGRVVKAGFFDDSWQLDAKLTW